MERKEEEIGLDDVSVRLVAAALVMKVSLQDWERLLAAAKKLGQVVHQRVEPVGTWLWIEKDQPGRRGTRT